MTYQAEDLRVVSDDLWCSANARSRASANVSEALRRGRKSRYLLSGLLKCGVCGRNYTGWGADHYACRRYTDGRACKNRLRVKRAQVDNVILGQIMNELLDPDRVERMAKEMQREAQTHLEAATDRAAAATNELQELDDRIARLHKRLAANDPDIAADELQAALDKAQSKRAGMFDAQPAAKASAKLIRILPNAANLYRAQIMDGVDGDRDAAHKARLFLRN